MSINSRSIRAFIGARDYNESRAFYKDLDFEEVILNPSLCLFKLNDKLAFYLQNAYVKDWVDNTKLFIEVDDLNACEQELAQKNLCIKYPTVRLSSIKDEPWGRELFLHDPSGILWHFGQFK